ncbi:MAG: intracellular sulfur oxidation DsrE/DsrF family protein [Sulfurimonas sp.]|jgi:intracellular sulfur oxidation DsrE/DsrF family protein
MKKLILTLLALSCLLSANEATNKVVIDLTTSNLKTFEGKILRGIVAHKNHYEGNLKELEVAVVIHGGSYKFFVKDLSKTTYKDEKKLIKEQVALQKRIANMSQTYNVEFLMCNSGRVKHKLEKENILSFVKYVPNAAIGLIDKQNEGFAYLPVSN